MATVHLTDSGQSFPVDDEIAANDELLKATLRSVIPEIGEPNIKRERKDGQLVVTVVKQAGRKGLLLNTDQAEPETELGETAEGGGIGTILLDLGIIRTDGGTQARAAISEETVEEYEQGVRGGDDFPPVVVFYDGENYWLADGFQRLLAHQRAGESRIEAKVKQGTRRDAILYAAGANTRHGLRRNNEDKRRAVAMMLGDPEWSQWSDRSIADHCGVTHPFVGNMRRELSGNGYQMPQQRIVHRGEQTYSYSPAGPKPKPELEQPGEMTSLVEDGSQQQDHLGVQDVELVCRRCGATDSEGQDNPWVEDDEGVLCGNCAQPGSVDTAEPVTPAQTQAQTFTFPAASMAATTSAVSAPGTPGTPVITVPPPANADPTPVQAAASTPALAPAPVPPPPPSSTQALPTANGAKAPSFTDASVQITLTLMPIGKDQENRRVLITGVAVGVTPAILGPLDMAALEPLPAQIAEVLTRIEGQYS